MTSRIPRVEVEIKASATCYLSNDPPFFLILHTQLYDAEEEITFLQDGCESNEDYQPINSNQVIQCFDDETGEEVQVLRQGTKQVLLVSNSVYFTTSANRQSYELPFVTSSLQAGRKYRLRFRPTRPISHWPGAYDALVSSENANNESVRPLNFPTPPIAIIPWKAAGAQDIFVFETKASQPRTPNVTASISAPPTYSLTKPFTFTLTFATDASDSITVFAERGRVQSLVSDIEILDAKTRAELGPDSLIVCREDDDPERKDLLQIDGTYTEHRELDFRNFIWEDMELKIGEEYILRHKGDSWWWTESSIDQVMAQVESRSSVGLANTKSIKFASAGEVTFKVVE